MNYYTKFSLRVENLTSDEYDWLKQAIDGFQNDTPDEGEGERAPNFQYLFQDDDATLALYSDEDCDIDAVCDLLESFIAQFRPDQAIGFAFSFDGGRPTTDAYGGGAVFITKDGHNWINTERWLAEQHERWITACRSPTASPAAANRLRETNHNVKN